MARAIWSGSVSFGLVNVPVKAYTASRDHEVHFHQLEKGSGARIRYQKISDTTGKEVDADDIEHGYELHKGEYVIVDPDELDSLKPRTTRTIDVNDFVPLDDIDPIYYERTYWVAPDGEQAERAYRLLLAALEDRQLVGIGTVVMRRKQYLAAIRPLDGALAMSTMRFADEIVDKADIGDLPQRASKPDPKELKLATTIVDSLTTEWDPKQYHDTYTEELVDLIKQKAAGKEITVDEETVDMDNVIDLMAALEASVANARKGRSGASKTSPAKRATKKSAKKAPAKKAPVKKAPAKKSASKAPARKSA